MKITDTQAENTRMAYAIMAGIPKELIDLNDVRTDNVSDQEMRECGSVGCIAGWLSAHPYFINQGLVSEMMTLDGGRPYVRVDLNLDEPLFGDCTMFGGQWKKGMSGKQEALQRLRNHLFDSGRITKRRSEELATQEANL